MYSSATLTSVKAAKDWEKTFDFLVFIWETLYRQEFLMFMEYTEQKSVDSASFDWNKANFFTTVYESMKIWQEKGESYTKYLDSAQALKEKLCSEYLDDFKKFCDEFCAKNETFRLWHVFIHDHCMNLIQLYLAGRSANFDLRNRSLKALAPLFYLIPSNYYYRLIPIHLHDLAQYPPAILEHLRDGACCMNLSPTNWSAI